GKQSEYEFLKYTPRKRIITARDVRLLSPSLSKLKGSRLSGLVRISAMLSSEETFSIEMFPFCTLSWRKWCWISICLARECRTGFLLTSIAPLLSHRTCMSFDAIVYKDLFHPQHLLACLACRYVSDFYGENGWGSLFLGEPGC
ncbi:hypothetical protein Tco_0883605, partial [Tanacetum coccineum]